MATEPNLVMNASASSSVESQRNTHVEVRNTTYRADIDGLRAVAVLLVLVFHGGLAVFPSGFIGVDIFFVISGYLTTGIILKALANGDFSLRQFYARRMWRLQPAIVVLLIATLAAASVVYLPRDFVDFLKSGKYASLLLSNQYFANATDGYATAKASTLPLLHTWSLAIEWQWYLILPLGLLLLNRVLAGRQLQLAVVLLTVAFVAVALCIAKVIPDKSYYSFLARIFELLIGACAALLNGACRRVGRTAASLIGLCAMGVILFSATQPISITAYPGIPAVLVCLATALLVSGGAGRTGVTSSILSWSPVVFVGTVSYSLYLWHWPVIAIVDYLGIERTPVVIAFYFVSSFALGIASYYLIEKPLRRIRMGVGKSFLLLVAAPAIAFSVLYAVGKQHDGWLGRFGAGPNDILYRLQASEIPQRKGCLGSAAELAGAQCLLGQQQSNRTALLIGDSYSNHFIGFVDVLAKDAHVSVLARASQGCLALPDVYLYDWWKYTNVLYTKCHDAAAAYHTLIASNHYSYVMIGLNWKAYADSTAVVYSADDPRSQALSRERMKAALLKSLGIIVASGAVPVLFDSNIPMPTGANDCVYRSIKLRETLEEQGCATSVPAPPADAWIEALLQDAQKAYPSMVVIDAKDVQCASGTCKLTIDGLPIYRDIGHITDFASTAMGHLYLESKGNPLSAEKP